MAVDVMAYRTAVKEIARESCVYVAFLPKPVSGEYGSGMHALQPFFKQSKRGFCDGKDR